MGSQMRSGPRGAWLIGFLACLLGAPLLGQGQADDRSSRVDYVIEARVDGETKVLDGRETITWTNRTSAAASDLWFHLYINAFSNNRSTHLWEGKGKVRRGGKMERGWGWQRVTSVKVGGTELVDQLEFGQPDDGRGEDRTVIRIPLPQPVEPGASITIELEWASQLPQVQRRTGYKDRFLFIAQWFPKLGVFEGAAGWNCHQFHYSSEFYSNFGTYDVTLDLPEEYAGKVGASGVQAGEPIVADGRVRTRFLAPSLADRERVDWTGKSPLVHDFTWTADPGYVVRDEVFSFDAWATRFADDVAEVERSLAAAGEGVLGQARTRDVKVRVLIQPERESQWQRHFEATCAALFFYGLWFGEYPYEQITVVDPAWGGHAAGGMEYPTLFTCGTRLFTSPRMHRPEGVTVHEAGHQFWYGLVANNEFENPWMDEGFNSYTDSEAMYRAYGETRAATWYADLPVWGRRATARPGGRDWADWITMRKIPLGLVNLRPLGPSGFMDWWKDQPLLTLAEQVTDPRWADRSGYLRNPEWDPITTSSWEFVDTSSYGTNSYPRPAAALRTLAGLVGRETFLRGMRSYAKEWRYRHPYPDDFFEAFQAGADVDMAWYMEDVFRGTGTLDWSVQVGQRRTPPEIGFFQGSDGAFAQVAEADDEDEEEDEDEDDFDDEGSFADGEERLFDVLLRRKGTLRLPVDVLVKFDDDTEQTYTWSREMQADVKWWRLPIPPGPRKIHSVILDPERLILLDADMSDNQWYAESDEVMPWRWAERVLVQYEHILHWFANTGG
ncbi:MAG: hypothetical protein ACI8QZ_000005 [Chlamydiales bacterium]|jgi:hypothetical protein